MTEQYQQGASCREVEDRVAAAEGEAESVAMSDKGGGEGTGEQAHGEGTGEQAIVLVGEHGESTDDPAVIAYTTTPSLVGEHSTGIGDLAMVLHDPSILGEHGEGTGKQAMVPDSPLSGESEHSDSDVEFEQENAALRLAMEVDDISQRPELVADGPALWSPGTSNSCLIDGHALPPGHVAIVIPATALDDAAGPPQKH